MRKRFWLRVVVFPLLIAAVNAAGVGLFYLGNFLGLTQFNLDKFGKFAFGYPVTVFFILAIFSILKLRGEDGAS